MDFNNSNNRTYCIWSYNNKMNSPLNINYGDNGRLAVTIYRVKYNLFVVRTYADGRLIERKRFYKGKRAVEYYNKILEEF